MAEGNQLKLADILPTMSKMYLNRIVSSFIRDVRIDDEDEMRSVILRNIPEFKNEERILKNLDFLEDPRDIEVLNELILICMVQFNDYLASSSELIDAVFEMQDKIVEDGQDSKYLASAVPEESANIYEAVLEAAWSKDDSLNAHEKNILEVLRINLGLSRRHHRLIESKIGRFPREGNKAYSIRQVENALKDLQQKGILLRFKTEDEYFVIPEEIIRTVRYARGGELKTSAFNTLLNQLTVNQLRSILEANNRRVSGTKVELVSRLQRFNLLPSEVLDILNVAELNDVMDSLEDIRKSGTKAEKISNIIDHFEHYATPQTSDPTDDRAKFYDVFDLVASRDYSSLRKMGLIQKDIEVERLFEAATEYLFEKKLNLPLMELPGTAHADGRLKIDGKQVLLWDNKSTETPYYFPDEHVDQFLGYIRADVMRPTVFLVVVSDYTDAAIHQAQKLKAFSDTDTDVALIKAIDLKYVAEHWKEYSAKKAPAFNLQLFNLTGGLTRDILKSRMTWAVD